MAVTQQITKPIMSIDVREYNRPAYYPELPSFANKSFFEVRFVKTSGTRVLCFEHTEKDQMDLEELLTQIEEVFESFFNEVYELQGKEESD